MRFGLCTGVENLELAAKLGFDYIECTVTGLEALGAEDFAALEERVRRSPLKVERCNVLFPGSFKLIGAEAEPQAIRAYLERAFPRLRALGASVLVFGSGRCRSFPPGMSLEEGFRELIKLTRMIGEMASAYGIALAVEPLNSEETNCVTGLREGALLEAAVDSPAVGLLADLYHILKEGEPVENILALGGLRHTHIALLEGRSFPTTPHPSVAAFFKALKEISYGGSMSIEGRSENLEQDAAAALKVLRSLA